MIGLKRGTIILKDNDLIWKTKAKEIISILKSVFKEKAIDIQHVGSTAINNIKAKPMIDIAVGIDSFDNLTPIFEELYKYGIYNSQSQPIQNDILCALKTDIDSDICISAIHIELYGSTEWKNHIYFRDYMNEFQSEAFEYEKLKETLYKKFPNDRDAYSKGKGLFIANILSKAFERYN